MSEPEAVVRRYFEVVADLDSSREALLELLDPDVRVVERPNAITPSVATRDRDGVIEGFLAGKQLLAQQSFDIHELVAAGDRVAVRATWRGTIGEGRGALASGTELVAHVAAWLTVADGRIREHETFDCYEPLPA